MARKFKVLRFVGTLWKVFAWFVLIVGILTAFGVLGTSILGGGSMSRLMPNQGQMPWAPWAFGALGGIVGFVATFVVSLLQFIVMYAVGELIYLLLAIEENTRPPAAS